MSVFIPGDVLSWPQARQSCMERFAHFKVEIASGLSGVGISQS